MGVMSRTGHVTTHLDVIDKFVEVRWTYIGSWSNSDLQDGLAGGTRVIHGNNGDGICISSFYVVQDLRMMGEDIAEDVQVIFI